MYFIHLKYFIYFLCLIITLSFLGCNLFSNHPPDNSLAPQVKGSIMKALPYTACGPIENADQLRGHIALALRGDCMFAGKARRLQEAGATGVIFIGE